MKRAVSFLIGGAIGLWLNLSADAAHDGAQLYARHCAACHGTAGSGGVGVPLALADFLAQVDDRYLRETIRRGRPGRVMPPFPQLSDAEIDALVRHIRTWQRPGRRPAAVTVGRGDSARGAKLYAERCAACHGAQGEGGHGTGVTFSRPRDLPVLAPSLNNPGFLVAASDRLIKTTLAHGREGTPMKSFLEQGLNDRDLDDVVAYVREFEKLPLPAKSRVLETQSAVIVRDSPYDLKLTVERLKVAFQAANMRVIRSVPFDEGMVAAGRESPRRWIVDACDFPFLNQALAVDPRVGLFLPCRATVVEHAGKVQVMTVNPKRLSAIFNNAELNELCDQMYKAYVNILEEATL